jgi:hypothetical protein
VRDDAGTAISGASLLLMTMTLYNEADPQDIINFREDSDVKGYVDLAGAFAIPLGPDDMVIQDVDELTERHRALLVFYWNSGTRRNSCEIQIIVRNVAKV